MRAIKCLPALGLLLGLALVTTSCSYFREQGATKLYNKGVELQKQNSLDEAVSAYDDLIEKYSQDTGNPSILKVVCAGMQNKAIIFHRQASAKRSLALADSMIATCGADPREEVRSEVADAMYNKAVAYEKQNQYPQAIETHRHLIETYGRDTAIDTRRTVASASFKLGYMQAENRQFAEAANTFRQMIGAYARETDGEILRPRLLAMYNLGSVLQEDRQFDEALTCYDQLIGAYAGAHDSSIQEIVMKSLVQKVRVYVALRRPEDAGKAYVQLVKAFAPGSVPEQRLFIASAGLHLGGLLREHRRMDEAVTLYDDLIDRYAGDAGSDMRTVVATALQEKAMAIQDRSPDDALVVFEQVVKIYGADREPGVSRTVGYSLNAAAYKRLLIAKREWRHRERAVAELHAAQEEINASLARIPGRSWTLGNLAYVQWLLGDQAAAAQSFARALDDPKNGGATIYKDTLGDIGLFPIREDAGFRRMIDQEWVKFGSRHPGST